VSGKTELAARIEQQPNGLVVSPDQKWLYVARSGANDVWRFRRGPGGVLSEGGAWANLEPDAEPDGMTVDSKGNLYVAQAGNGKLCVISPEGTVCHLVKVCERMATNCEFHGGDESVLYVTGGGKQGQRTGCVWRLIFPK
jgi:gluconolactonase